MYYNDFDKEEFNKDTWTATETHPVWIYGGFTIIALIWTIGLIHTVFYIVDFFKWIF